MVVVLLVVAVAVIVVLGAAWESWRAARRAIDGSPGSAATLRVRCRPDDRALADALIEMAAQLDLTVAPPVWADRWYVADGSDHQIERLADGLLRTAEDAGFAVRRRHGSRTVLRRRLMWLTIERVTA